MFEKQNENCTFVKQFQKFEMDTYKTISSGTEGIYKEKGSKFLSFAIPVQQIDEVKEIVKEFHKRFFDARHVCYAYMLGHERTDFRANDDGEPSGTAGRPILGQINSRELTNILVIVVRYFGGILLGTGGLITAYKEAAADALNKVEIETKTVDQAFHIKFDYILLNDVMRIVKETGAQIVSQIFDNECEMKLSIRKLESSVLKSKLEKVNGLIFEDEQ